VGAYIASDIMERLSANLGADQNPREEANQQI